MNMDLFQLGNDYGCPFYYDSELWLRKKLDQLNHIESICKSYEAKGNNKDIERCLYDIRATFSIN